METNTTTGFTRVAAYLLSILIIILPVITYVPQYLTIREKQNEFYRTFEYSSKRVKGSLGDFSPITSFILLTANILRIYWWFTERYRCEYLIQSCFLVLFQLLMIQLINNDMIMSPSHDDDLTKLSSLWELDHLHLYILMKVILIVMTIFFLLNYIILKSKTMSKLIGRLALFIEACLPIPQLCSVYAATGPPGVSHFMIIGWLVGDAFKLWTYYKHKLEIEFKCCAIAQFFVDTLIVLLLVVRQ